MEDMMNETNQIGLKKKMIANFESKSNNYVNAWIEFNDKTEMLYKLFLG